MRTQLTTFALAAFIATGATVLLAPTADAPAPQAEAEVASPWATSTAKGEPGFDTERARLERRVSAAERLMTASPRSWMRRADLAGLYLERASLTASYADYQAAEHHIDEAIALGPHAAQLYLLRAQLSFTLHRFDRVEADLVLPERAARRDADQGALAAIQAMRGSLAFERGDYEEAETLLSGAVEAHRSYDGLARLAHLHFKTCRFDSAAALLSEAEAELPERAVRARAWLHLQRGLMALDRGRYDEAFTHYADADAAYPGWWLVEEHMAEIDALEGRTDSARERYERVVAATDSPELMGALAGVIEANEPTRAASLVKRARAIYEEQLGVFPEATYGHALAHFLELERDPSLAVALAEKNGALRPNGEAKTKLAAAYAKAGRLDDARATLDLVSTTTWCTADTHATAALVARRSGDLATAQRESALARAINPHAVDDATL